jgi:hypothetical protein
MAEKKEETKAVQEVTYTVDEFAENPQVLDTTEDIIRAAFAQSGLSEATESAAQKLVNTFRRKEV